MKGKGNLTANNRDVGLPKDVVMEGVEMENINIKKGKENHGPNKKEISSYEPPGQRKPGNYKEGETAKSGAEPWGRGTERKPSQQSSRSEDSE